MTKNLKVIKFINGEEAIAEVVGSDVDRLTVKDIFRIVVLPNPQDPKNPQVGFGPFLRWSDETELDLNHTSIVCLSEPISDFVKQHNQMTSALVIPENTLILPN